MRETRLSGSEGGEVEANRPSLPLFVACARHGAIEEVEVLRGPW
jgi:hypothetical protein